MRFGDLFRLSFVATGILLIPLVSAATTIVPADFAEMVAGSQTIVHGRVTDVRAQATAGRRSIESLVTIAVLDAIKGTASGQVVFRVPGGRIGRYRRVTVGAPEFAPGDEVVLFLSGRAPAMPMPFGLNQGVYRVNRTAAQALVTPLLTEAAGRVVRGDPARRPLPVEAFARRVRAEMERR
jgi:hypothetical protein